MNTPLSMVLEKTRLQLIQSFNQVIGDSKLPAYLYEGILLDILSEVRNRKNLELIMDINTYQEKAVSEDSGITEKQTVKNE